VDYQIITFDPNTGIATIGIPAVPTVLTGLPKLTQIVALSFLRNPGQSVLAPTEGSGVRADIGTYNYTVDGSQLKTLAVQATAAVQLEVITRQDPNTGTPDERLSSLVLKDFAYDADSQQALMLVQIVAESGSSANLLV
jgi:hypothetical protein